MRTFTFSTDSTTLKGGKATGGDESAPQAAAPATTMAAIRAVVRIRRGSLPELGIKTMDHPISGPCAKVEAKFGLVRPGFDSKETLFKSQLLCMLRGNR
jgi:hypothetical protein